MADLDSDAPDLVALVRRADPTRQRALSRAVVAAALETIRRLWPTAASRI